MDEIANRILELRTLAGLDSGQLANLLNWSPGKLSHKETGKRATSILDAIKICEKLTPFIGDRFIYLTKGITSNEHQKQTEKNAAKGFVYYDDALKLFNDVIARSVRGGIITISDAAADDMAKQFAHTLSDQCGFKENPKLKSIQ